MAASQSSGEQAQTREEYKKNKLAEERPASTGARRIRVRLIPIPLRIVLLVILVLLSVSIGTMVGYSAMGGGKTSDVFKPSTWYHIRDLVDKEK